MSLLGGTDPDKSIQQRRRYLRILWFRRFELLEAEWRQQTGPNGLLHSSPAVASDSGDEDGNEADNFVV